MRRLVGEAPGLSDRVLRRRIWMGSGSLGDRERVEKEEVRMVFW